MKIIATGNNNRRDAELISDLGLHTEEGGCFKVDYKKGIAFYQEGFKTKEGILSPQVKDFEKRGFMKAVVSKHLKEYLKNNMILKGSVDYINPKDIINYEKQYNFALDYKTYEVGSFITKTEPDLTKLVVTRTEEPDCEVKLALDINMINYFVGFTFHKLTRQILTRFWKAAITLQVYYVDLTIKEKLMKVTQHFISTDELFGKTTSDYFN